ncbi:hypothetical protein [Crenobacter luteus]|uniref:hypothetical protein n=1 Tax=Crenobacter luteus TaxID=1452487 RepID=UPI001E51C1C3|nr:hypothetical protein [Crenobacter luteus]
MQKLTQTFAGKGKFPDAFAQMIVRDATPMKVAAFFCAVMAEWAGQELAAVGLPSGWDKNDRQYFLAVGIIAFYGLAFALRGGHVFHYLPIEML